MAEKSDEEEVVCEFFGMQITTKNPNVARILQTDMGELLNQDVKLNSRSDRAKGSTRSDSDGRLDRHAADEADSKADLDEDR